MTRRPVILYELNEVPWRVVDLYTQKRPNSVLSRILPQSRTFTSHTRDVGELHPWTTWPTVHRGVYNTQHKIQFLNQDLSGAAAFPPIWEVVARAGRKVGVFGSLQSYPPPEGLEYAFYIPDTFAPSPKTQPKRYSSFQRLNLRQTQRDGAVATPVRIDAQTVADLLNSLFVGLSVRTIAMLAKQILLERLEPLHRTRRPIMQAPVAFDIFKHAFARTRPDFATFFTNHVAGIMHRYWKHSFPEDFQYKLAGAADEFRAENLMVAMDIADHQVGVLCDFVNQRDGILIVASSMGQQAVERDVEAEVRITDPRVFIRALGFESTAEPRLAMQPDFNFECDDVRAATALAARVGTVRDESGKSVFFRIQTSGRTVNCGLGRDTDWVKSERIILHMPGSAPRTISFREAGMTTINRDIGTGYHQPNGIVVLYGQSVKPASDRRKIESIDIAPMILAELGLQSSHHATTQIANERSPRRALYQA